jgi:hypothetical protein
LRPNLDFAENNIGPIGPIFRDYPPKGQSPLWRTRLNENHRLSLAGEIGVWKLVII